jgi:hypothetical protein
MATINLGRIKPVFRGAYAGGTAYVVDDIVTHGNESFICIQAGTGNATSNASYWTKLAAKGTDGTDVGTTLTTQGDMLYRDGSGLQRLAKGTATQILQMNAGATAPEWTAKPEGKTLQIVRADATGNTTDSSTTSSWAGGTIANDGTAHITIAFTPVSATSIIVVHATAGCGQGGNDLALAAIFSDSTPRAYVNSNGHSADASGVGLHASWVSGGTSAQSIQFRAMGCWSGSTMNLGDLRGDSGSTAPYGTMTIQEIQP